MFSMAYKSPAPQWCWQLVSTKPQRLRIPKTQRNKHEIRNCSIGRQHCLCQRAGEDYPLSLLHGLFRNETFLTLFSSINLVVAWPEIPLPLLIPMPLPSILS